MRPPCYDQDRPERVINGPRPSPLQINKNSNVIQKPLFQLRKPPVIIYTHSPKIIHTKPSDFMALVQKLTGFTQQYDDAQTDPDANKTSSHQNSILDRKVKIRAISYDEKESSLAVTDEKYDETGDAREASSSVPPPSLSRNRTLLADFPLFTPNYSADHVLRYSNMVFPSLNMDISVPSPSFLEVMKKDLLQN